MNFAELRTAFYDWVDDEVKDLYKTDKAGRLINRSLEMLGRKLEVVDEWYFIDCVLFAVTSSSKDLVFNLPNNFKRIKTAERLFDDGSDPVPVKWVQFPDRYDFESFFPNRSNRLRRLVRPRCYLLGSRLGVVTPNEDFTLRVWYSQAIPELDDEGDIPLGIPQDHHVTITLQAAKLAFGIEGRVFPFLDEFNEGLRDLMTTTQSRQRQEPRYVQEGHYQHGD